MKNVSSVGLKIKTVLNINNGQLHNSGPSNVNNTITDKPLTIPDHIIIPHKPLTIPDQRFRSQQQSV